MQHLPAPQTAGSRPIRLNIRNGTGLHSPYMVQQQPGIHPKGAVKPLLVPFGPQGNIPHGEHSGRFQLACRPRPHPPKIRQRTVFPQQAPIGHFIQLGYPYPVFIGVNVLGHNIHGHLAQIQVRAYPRRSCNAGGFQHIQNQPHGKFAGRQPVSFQVRGRINKYLIDGINMNVLRRHILQVGVVYFGAYFQVMGHLRRRHNIVQLQGRICCQFRRLVRFSRKDTARCPVPPPGIHLPHLLHHLKKSGTSRQPIGLQRRRNRQTNGFFGTPGIGHHQVGRHGVQAPFHTLHRSKK